MPKYRIDYLADFAEIPPERLEECLAEFAEWVGLVRERLDKMREDKEDQDDVAYWSRSLTFIWADDGKRGPNPDL